jgi:hypothetical protein
MYKVLFCLELLIFYKNISCFVKGKGSSGVFCVLDCLLTFLFWKEENEKALTNEAIYLC